MGTCHGEVKITPVAEKLQDKGIEAATRLCFPRSERAAAAHANLADMELSMHRADARQAALPAAGGARGICLLAEEACTSTRPYKTGYPILSVLHGGKY